MNQTEMTANEQKKNIYFSTGSLITYITVFLLISLTPLGLFVYSYSAGMKGMNIEKSENREFPVIYDESGINENFDDQCEAWMNQNIPFRGQLISGINYVLSEKLMVPTANVVPGKEEWIYSNETLADYMNTNEMSDVDIHNLGITLSLIQERIHEENGHFLFVPVPNKNSVYPEYMPNRYLKSDYNNLSHIYQELDSSGICYANILDDLNRAKEQNDVSLYYKRDTHWNVFGAMCGYHTMMEKLERTPLVYDSEHYSVDHNRVGDLDKLLYPSFQHYEEEYGIDYQLDYDGFEFIFPSGVEDTKAQLENFMSDREDHDNNFTTKKRQADDNLSLYMIRDSFGRALLPFMIDSYSEATFVRSLTPSIEKTIGYDDVIYEICERNLKNVIQSAPFMYAPIRENIYTNTISYNSGYNTCFIEDEGYAFHIYGTIDPGMIGQDGRIYIRLFNDTQVLIYEAFPILEEDLLRNSSADRKILDRLADSKKIQGYSLYINKSELKDDHIRIRLISGDYESDVLADIHLQDLNQSNEVEDTYDINPYKGENTDYQLVYRGNTFGIGDNMNKIKVALGDQAAPSEIVTSCLSGTDAIMYYYPNITIESDMEGNIYYISLMNNSYSDGEADATTTKGITIGSDLRHIWDVYGIPDTENDRNCSYHTEHLKITYSYKNGYVTSVIIEDRKFISDEDISTQPSGQKGVEYDKGNTYLYDDTHSLQTGWQIIDGEYYFFDRITGERIVGQTVDGIVIDEDGGVQLSQYEQDKIATMMKAHKIMEENTEPSDTMEEKRLKVFRWVMSFPYNRLRSLKDFYQDEGVEIMEANDIFEDGIGDCVSEAAAVAFLFHEIGYNNVYWAHDTGHAWVRCDDRLFDPLFAESRGFDANYDAPFTDFRGNTNHMMLIY